MTATQPQLFDLPLSPNDAVYTPDWAAKDMVAFFKPTGRVLEPCRGQGVIFRYLPAGSDWCEIEQGRDFFSWSTPVDWILSNPPYSIFKPWLLHSLTIADNIVYLIPLHKFFNAYGLIKMTLSYGWLKHVRVYGTGTKLEFPMGNAIGAVHLQRGYYGCCGWSFYEVLT